MRNDQQSALLMDYLLKKQEITTVANPLEAAKTRRKTHYIKKVLQLHYMSSMHDRCTIENLNGIMKRKTTHQLPKLKVSVEETKIYNETAIN